MPKPNHPQPPLQPIAETPRRHSLFWLIAANSVGILLAIELLLPGLGDRLAPLTYGRWMPLHLNWQLYGWCALPLVGLVMRWIGGGPDFHSTRPLRVALWAWSLALAAGGVSWLCGLSSGKLFLDWHGWARPLLPTAMTLLWLALAWQFWTQRTALTRSQYAAQALFLLGLFAVPPLLFWATGTNVYPSVNPRSGGATGTSLLGSTLGIVAIYGLMPELLNVPAAGKNIPTLRRAFWALFTISCLVFVFLDHAHASNATISQQIGLGVLIFWIPVVRLYFRAFAWSAACQPWLKAAFFWWLLLVLTGFGLFLPILSEKLKFTNALVAHAHLAMAGLITSLNFAILNLLAPEKPLLRGFWLWQAATAIQFTALTVLGWIEANNPGAFFRNENATPALYGARLAAGLLMAIVSIRWFLTSTSTDKPPRLNEF